MERLINAVFIDKNRNITQEDGLEIWSLPQDTNIYWGGTSTQRLVIQPQWLDLYTQLIGGAVTHVLLEGKAGRGKSVFLRYMIIRMLEDPAIPSEDTFAYVEKYGENEIHTFWIVKNGIMVTVLENISEQPTYLFLDNVDSTLSRRGEKLNIGLTSGDKEVLKIFRKRVHEAGVLGSYYVMKALDFTVMKLIFPLIPPADLQFRFDVVGGNPRRFQEREPVSMSVNMQNNISRVLESCISMFFGAAYDQNLETVEGLRARWAIRVISKEVQQSANFDSSFFFADFATVNGYSEEQFASTFLRLVAGALESKNNATMRDLLQKIVGSSGVGFAHEYLSHAAFLGGRPTTTTFGLNPLGSVVQLPALYGRQVALVRNIADLTNMKDLDAYLFPTISNFPAVDAIVSTNLLQMTISDKHEGALDKLPDIASALGVEVKHLLLIFVVESVEKAWAFRFPVLEGVRMVVTPRVICSEQALRTGH